ncbi:MAG: catalase-related domain-containing protein, partial [Vulcanimicrobiaceae bacterium]
EPAYTLAGTTSRYAQTSFRNDNYTQPGDLYRLMKQDEKDRLVDTLVDHMGSIKRETKERQLVHWVKVDADLGTRVARGLGLPAPAVVKEPAPAK